MLSPEAIMKPSRIAPEPMISFSPFPPRSRVRISRSVWFLVALCITLLGSVEAQSCGYDGTEYDCDFASQTTMPSSFLSSTTYVSLGGNQITSIPVNSFQGLISLTRLYLNFNQITSIPVNSFQGLTALAHLVLEDNQITSIPVNSFQGLTALTQLDLEDNQITSIPVNAFQGLTALWLLKLGGNQITSIPVNIFQGLTALREFGLGGSPLECNILRYCECTNVLEYYYQDNYSIQCLPPQLQFYIPIGILVAMNLTFIVIFLRRRGKHHLTVPPMHTDTSDSITPSSSNITIERTYSEIEPNNSGYEIPMRHNPAYESRTSRHIENEEDERHPQPYALLETSRKTYETTGVETSQYDVATMMTGSNPRPYNEVVEMSSW